MNKSETATMSRQRLKILSQDEIENLYGLPRLSAEEQEHYFTLSGPEKTVFERLKRPKSKISFILQLGYFKVRHMLFVFTTNDVVADMNYIAERYLTGKIQADCTVTNVTRLKQQGLILALCNYKTCSGIYWQQLELKAHDAAVLSGKPIFVLRQILQFLIDERIVSPAYSTLQDIVGKALTDEQSRIGTILKKNLTNSDTKALIALMDDKSDFYQITYLKHAPTDFSATEIKLEVSRGGQIKELYELSKRILPALKISNESIKYYASLVGYYSVFRLKRFKKWTAYIYLLCFIKHRYQQHCDNLLAGFIYYVKKFSEVAKMVAKERVYEH
jgi:hypothetical protein